MAFSKIEKLRVQPDLVRVFVFDEVEGAPSLRVRSATEANKPYMNAILRASKRAGKSKVLDAETIAANRASDLDLYPQHVVLGWKDPALTDEGRPATEAEVADFLRALPPTQFDLLRSFCSLDANFREGADSADLLGN